MSTILAIRGTNGSGKSTLMRQFMAQMKRTGRIAWDGRVSGYRFTYHERTVFVLGRYANDCGGLDSSFSYKGAANDVCDAIRELAEYGDVITEGVVAISSYGVKRMIQLATNLAAQGHRLILATLDTPEEVCIERVKSRRAARGNVKPFNPENLRCKLRSIHKDHDRLLAMGLDCRWISSSASLSELLATPLVVRQEVQVPKSKERSSPGTRKVTEG